MSQLDHLQNLVYERLPVTAGKTIGDRLDLARSIAQTLVSEIANTGGDAAKVAHLVGVENRVQECMQQKHGDRYGSLWMDTFRFILEGEYRFNHATTSAFDLRDKAHCLKVALYPETLPFKRDMLVAQVAEYLETLATRAEQANHADLPPYRYSTDRDGDQRIVALDAHTQSAILRLCEFVQKHDQGAAWADARDVRAAVEAPENARLPEHLSR